MICRWRVLLFAAADYADALPPPLTS